MMTYLATGNIVLKPHLVVVCNECQWEVFRLYRANFQASKYWDAPKTMACINAIAADMDEEAEILSTSLYQMFQNLVQNNRKPLQSPVNSLTYLMNAMSEEARFHVNQMTACSFVGSTKTLTAELKEFIRISQVDELMISSPIYEHQAKLKNLRLLKEVMAGINGI